jgi:hypothetical protein
LVASLRVEGATACATDIHGPGEDTGYYSAQPEYRHDHNDVQEKVFQTSVLGVGRPSRQEALIAVITAVRVNREYRGQAFSDAAPMRSMSSITTTARTTLSAGNV